MKSAVKWWWTVLVLPLLAAGGFIYWGETPLPPMPEALAALQSDPAVQVQVSPWLTFEPTGQKPVTGLIYYPGGRVDARAYAPAAHALAARGFLVMIIPMPLNLAFFGAGKAADVIAAHPEIKHWAVAGHSLGGVAAAGYARQHPGQIQGIAFWASYPASSDSLATIKIQATSIYGTNDGLATGDKIAASRLLLPPATHWVAIQGGNHAQFGWYGPQPGDQPAAISRQEQQQQAVEATAALLEDISK